MLHLKLYTKRFYITALFWPILSIFSIFNLFSADSTKNIPEQKIVVIMASYNNNRIFRTDQLGQHVTCLWSLKTIFAQDYSNYEIRYVDDNSTDGQQDVIRTYVNQKNLWPKFKYRTNTKRLGALQNQYEEIMKCNDNDIIIIVDGDDGLANTGVFKYLNEVYSDPNVWLTYGQFKHLSNGQVGFCRAMPEDVYKNNFFRGYKHIPSHLRTCRAWLFKRIKKEDLMINGEFLQMTGDMATWVPMIEMASRGHFRFISKVLYTYNDMNPISDHKKDVDLQKRMDDHIRSLPPYRPL